MKLTQNEEININFEISPKKAMVIIDDVTLTSLLRHNYVIFHIFSAKIENLISEILLATEFVHISLESIYQVLKDN